jgi:murein DD-endopeptidase MepM/ murein hydrolase activator NlpD
MAVSLGSERFPPAGSQPDPCYRTALDAGGSTLGLAACAGTRYPKPVADAPEPIIPLEERTEERSMSARGGAADLPDLGAPDAEVQNTPTRMPRMLVPPRRREAEGPPAAPRGGTSLSGTYSLPGGVETPTAAPPPAMARVHGGGVYLSPRMTAVFGGLFGLATVTSIVALLIQVVPPRDERAMIANAALAHQPGAPQEAPQAASALKRPKREAIPGPWRIAELGKDPSVEMQSGTFGGSSFIDALGEKGVPKAQAYRIMKAFEGTRKFDKCGKKDRFSVAIDRATKRVRGFEYEVSPTEIYQAREDQGGILTGQKLDMKVAEAEVVSAFYVGKDVKASYQAAGLEDGILEAIDEALMGRMSTEAFEEGGTVRLVVVEETALGLFAKYKKIVAFEYRPPDPAAKPVRIYNFRGQEAHGWFDERGRQPGGGGWRAPVQGAPVTSRFNPKRLHPVLHTVMPHQGTDFGAPMGTPVYSAYKGTVESVGPAGPSGNLVTISHPNGVTTGYAHLSRFAAGIKPGMKIGAHQLVGYVGSTGRSTGPHLHFSAKRDGKFFDAETLHLDGESPMPVVDRSAFLEVKAALDKRLDEIPLPEPPAERPAPGAAPAASGAPAAAGSGAPAPGPVGSAGAGAAEPGMKPSGFVEDNGDDDGDEGGQPIPAPLLNGLPMGPSSATPTSAGPPKKPAAAAPPDDPKEEEEAH